ncbi:methyltransferase domain-containing protein [Microcoleus sp. K1-B6]|uniref:methyltransferase domain-containing protein n=1 Tax=unclassified Microcoleus TaxID=2642155 RepID=UPI002FD47819
MLDVINKKEYFDWWDNRIADRTNHSLKGIQDAWIVSLFRNKQQLKIAEIGGGNSRVLNRFKQNNECWNIDKFEGLGGGPKEIQEMPDIKIVRSYIGDFDPYLPENYFDIIFSISVIEHIPKNNIQKVFADCHRLLKTGGMMAHAIDAYVCDIPIPQRLAIVDQYVEAIELQGFEWSVAPKIDKNLTFKSDFASNSDLTMAGWNHLAPTLRTTREQSQSISLKLLVYKK